MDKRTARAQQRWAIAFIREHGHPFSDYDVSATTRVFDEMFRTFHGDAYDEAAFLDQCAQASDEACDEWEARR